MAIPDRLLNAAQGSLRRCRRAVARRLASEGGFAVPTVLLMTVAAMGIASVGVMASIQGQSGTVRDQGSKTALAVAESGIDQALLHYNRGVAPCVPSTEGDWCGPVTGMSVNGGAVSYWTRLASGEDCGVGNEVECVEIVSQGTAGGVTRRVNVFASTLSTEESTGGGPFASASVLSLDTMSLDSNSTIHTGTATNGNLELSSNARQCGQASVGIGKEMKLNGNAGYYGDAKCTTPSSTVLQQELTLPPVNQGDAATNNDNGRFFAEDTVSGNKADACWSGVRADGKAGTCGTRELKVENNSAVTLGGSVYSFCKLTLRSNSALYIAAGAEVTIYFDSPENCGYSSTVTQLDLQSNSRITSATGDAISVAMLFVGSETIATKILLNSNTSVNGPCEQNFVIYAPRSDVELNSNSRFCGAIAGKTVHLDANAEVWTASGSESFTLPGVEIPEAATHYTPYRFVECSAVTASPPNAGC
jgi:type II secretory pathway pseudopilin PulG